MIDRFGKDSYGFTKEAEEVMHTAEELKHRLDHRLLAPHHVAHALVTHFDQAFGKIPTQKQLQEAFLSWGETEHPDPSDLIRFLNRASDQKSHPITNLDLLAATVALPVEPLHFFAGDQKSPLAYRESVYVRAGGQLAGAHYGSPAYSIVELSERFKVIPPGLLDKLHVAEPTPFTPENDIPRLPAGQILRISGRKTGREIRQYILA